MRRLIGFLFLTLLALHPLAACLWDSETLEQERQRFPGILELITGKFLRHSPAYYQWRLEDRERKLADDPTNERLLDDLAVSHEKLEQHAEAIEIARSQLERNPLRYETLANLGTFLIHDGQWAEGLEFIDRAIEVNPDAHFGREKYQRLLVQYLMELFPDGKVEYPLVAGERRLSFPDFLSRQLHEPDKYGGYPRLDTEETEEAIKGVTGMMRFARHDHPVLLEVLGQLLTVTIRPEQDAKQLATRCYLALAASAKEASRREQYEKLARGAIDMQTPAPGSTTQMPLERVQAEFRNEHEDADLWYFELVANEKKWIEAGADVEAEYRKLYREPPPAAAVSQGTPSGPTGDGGGVTAMMIAAVCIVIALAVIIPIAARTMGRGRKRVEAS